MRIILGLFFPMILVAASGDAVLAGSEGQKKARHNAEIRCLAQNIYFEARGEPDGRQDCRRTCGPEPRGRPPLAAPGVFGHQAGRLQAASPVPVLPVVRRPQRSAGEPRRVVGKPACRQADQTGYRQRSDQRRTVLPRGQCAPGLDQITDPLCPDRPACVLYRSQTRAAADRGCLGGALGVGADLPGADDAARNCRVELQPFCRDFLAAGDAIAEFSFFHPLERGVDLGNFDAAALDRRLGHRLTLDRIHA